MCRRRVGCVLALRSSRVSGWGSTVFPVGWCAGVCGRDDSADSAAVLTSPGTAQPATGSGRVGSGRVGSAGASAVGGVSGGGRQRWGASAVGGVSGGERQQSEGVLSWQCPVPGFALLHLLHLQTPRCLQSLRAPRKTHGRVG
ncbi:MAG: hypothetical protein WDW36_007958 [Sanguina aurantia]